MIIEEKINETLVRHYSDSGLKIKQVETNKVYNEAIDVIPCKYTYIETEEKINEENEEDTENKSEE